MDIPLLNGPNGKPIPPEKTFLVDGYGNRLSSKDFAVPTYLTVASVISGSNQTYLANQFDEALKHNSLNAHAMYRDCRIHGWLNERVDSVVNLKWHLKVPNEKDPAQRAVRDGLTIAVQRIPKFKKILRSLLKWGLWSGRGVSHLCWRWEEMNLPTLEQKNLFESMKDDLAPSMNGTPQQPEVDEQEPEMAMRKILMPFKSRPVNGDKINYTWGHIRLDDGEMIPPDTPLVRLYGAVNEEFFGEDNGHIVYDNMGPNLALLGPWRERFVIHNYDPDDADYFLPEMAGGIHGVGIRSRIYWLNWVRMEYAAWIQDLFDKVGLGFIVIKYDMGSAQAKREAELAAKKWSKRSVLAVPVSTDQLLRAGSIEVVEVPTTGAVVVQELVKYCDKAIERFILRQTMSGGGVSEGDGARGTVGPAQMAKNTETQRIKSDAEELAETLTGNDDEPGLLSVMKKHSYPGANFPVWFEFDIEDVSPKEKLQAVSMAAALEVEFKEDEVRNLTGMSKPSPSDKKIGGKKSPVDISGQAPSADGGGEGGAKGGDDKSRSREAAQEWISAGKMEGTLNQIAEKYGITRQAVGQEAKILEGGNRYADEGLEPVSEFTAAVQALQSVAANLVEAVKAMSDSPRRMKKVVRRDEDGLVQEVVEVPE